MVTSVKFDHAPRPSPQREHEPVLAAASTVGLISVLQVRGLYAPDDKCEHFVGEFRPVAERERTQTGDTFRDKIHELSPPASVGTSSGLKP